MPKHPPEPPSHHHAKKAAHPKAPKQSPAPQNGSAQPVFGQPHPSPDPTGFKNPVTDQKEPQVAKLEPVPQPRGGAVEPVLDLEQVFGDQGAAKMQAIQQAGQIVFHSVGDTGSPSGPLTQSLVSDKMVSDFSEANAADIPTFLYHLGDVVYYFGEATYYYDQFFEPYREYPAPIIAIPGNHDGVVYPKDPESTLDAFLRNFCSPSPSPSPDSGGLVRTTMIQPGAYFTLEAPFVRILGLYSNVLEDPGVISGEGGSNTVLDNRQIAFLTAALKRVKSENYTGAVIIAVHHPPYTAGTTHGGSPKMVADIDSACQAAGVWPHALFAGHEHNYQRYTRNVNNYQIPYMVAGCGGHSPLSAMRATYRTPYTVDGTLTLENYDAKDFGYLRVVVNAQTMRIEFHLASDGGTVKTPNDVVTVTLATHTIS